MNNTENGVSLLNQFPSNKSDIENFVNEVVAQIEEGNINALDLKVRLKFIEKIIDQIDDKTTEQQLTERKKFPEKILAKNGCKIELAEVGISYDYSTCNDADWLQYNEEVVNWTEKRKKREAFLKTLTHTIPILDEATGEVYKIYPPVKSSTTGLKFTINK